MEIMQFGDEQLYAAFGALQLNKTLQTCPSEKPISWMCHSDLCKASLYCGQDSCKHCIERHKNCGSHTRGIGFATNELNQLLMKKRQLVQKIRIIDNDFISHMIQKQRDMVRNSPFDDLKRESQDFIQLIYKKPGNKNISGKQSQLIMDDISKLNKHYQDQIPELIDWYSEEMQKLTKEAIRIKKKVLEALIPVEIVPEPEPQPEIDVALEVEKLFLKTKQLMTEKRNQEAINTYHELLALDPKHLKAQNNLGVLLSLSNKQDESMLCFEKAIAVDPTNVAAYNNIQVLFRKVENNELRKKAIGLMEGVLTNDRTNQFAKETLRKLRGRSEVR